MTSQVSIWKSMSLEEKYRLLASTIRQSRQIKRLGLQLSHPNATPEEIEQKLARVWLHARP
jgi:hypothetical protein